jgi:hypothetical protein
MTEHERPSQRNALILGILAVAFLLLVITVPVVSCSMCKGLKTINWINLDDGTPRSHSCFRCEGKGRESILGKCQWELQTRGYIKR